MYKGMKTTLREVRIDELPKITEYVNNYEAYSSFTESAPRPKSYEYQKLWYEKTIIREDIITFAIAEKETDRFIGTCQLRNIDRLNQVAMLSIIIGDSSSSGKGYGTDALTQLLRFAFLELNLERVELDVYEDNKGAIALYEKCGFKKEGVRKDQVYRNGHYSSQIAYSILKEEFKYEY